MNEQNLIRWAIAISGTILLGFILFGSGYSTALKHTPVVTTPNSIYKLTQ